MEPAVFRFPGGEVRMLAARGGVEIKFQGLLARYWWGNPDERECSQFFAEDELLSLGRACLSLPQMRRNGVENRYIPIHIDGGDREGAAVYFVEKYDDDGFERAISAINSRGNFVLKFRGGEILCTESDLKQFGQWCFSNSKLAREIAREK